MSQYGVPVSRAMFDAKRFWSRVAPPNAKGCRLWIGPTSGNGYGGHCSNGIQRRAHRVAYALTHGRLPAGKVVMHTCDVRLCCNPLHLRLGTQRQNIKDAVLKGRIPYRSGPETSLAKLSWAQADRIRRAYARGEGQKALAEKYGVHSSCISRLVRGLSYV